MKYTIFDANGNIIRPVMQVKYNSEDDVVSMADSSANIAARLQGDVMSTLYGTDHAKENFSELCVRLGLIGQDDTVSTKTEVFDILSRKAVNDKEDIVVGNVKLYDAEDGYRRPVPESEILAAGYMSGGSLWEIGDWPPSFGYQTLFAQTVLINDTYVIATPIKDDGTVLSKSEFNSYISECYSQNDAMEYDAAHDSLIAGTADSESDAKFCVNLIDEWEDYLMTSTIYDKATYQKIVNNAIENQDSNIKNICFNAAGITDENAVYAANQIYPLFNADTSESAWGRLRRLVYHELWNVIPRG